MSEDTGNDLLASLAAADYALLRPHLTRVHLEQRSVLQEAGQPIEDIFFPLEGMISVVASFPAGQEIEIAAIGREGAIGTKSDCCPRLPLPGPSCSCPARRFECRCRNSRTSRLEIPRSPISRPAPTT